MSRSQLLSTHYGPFEAAGTAMQASTSRRRMQWTAGPAAAQPSGEGARGSGWELRCFVRVPGGLEITGEGQTLLPDLRAVR